MFSQSIVFGHIIKENPSDTLNGNLTVYKQNSDSTFIVKEKKFRNESMVSLDPGEYIFKYEFSGQVFIDKVSIHDTESIIIMNILEKSLLLSEFDFSKAVYISLEMIDLAIMNRKDSYMEF
jgi:hypothetical protein